MKPNLRISLSLLLAGCLCASLSAVAQTKPIPQEVPVSLSYSQITKCYPELKNEAWIRKVELNELKEEMDRHFLTTSSLLRQREIILKDPNGLGSSADTKRLRLAAKPKASKMSGHDYHLTLEKLDAKGSGTIVTLPSTHRTNPEQKVLNSYLVNQEITHDQTSHFDTKLHGVTASYKKNFKQISEIELKAVSPSRRLFCEQQKDLGVVCTCFSK